jgi:hypothetical protein
MGTWGTGLFSDDLAADLRGDYRDLIGDGLPGPEATSRLIAEYASELRDLDSAPVFWLALAATQVRCGRLEDRVRDRAIEVIDAGDDLRRWSEDTRARARRAAVLAKLRRDLLEPSRPPVKIPRRIKCVCDWEVGEIIFYRLSSGRLAGFQTLRHLTDKGGTYPELLPLDWAGGDQLDQSSLERLAVRLPADSHRSPTLLLFGMKPKEAASPRLVRPRLIQPPRSRPQREHFAGVAGVLWAQLDTYLARTFNWT